MSKNTLYIWTIILFSLFVATKCSSTAEAATQSCVGCHTITNSNVAACDTCHAPRIIRRNMRSVCKGCHMKALSKSRVSWKSNKIAEW